MIAMFSFPQLIQTISAVDKDDPLGGQKFFFSLAAVNPNFTVQDNEGYFCTVFVYKMKKIGIIAAYQLAYLCYV